MKSVGLHGSIGLPEREGHEKERTTAKQEGADSRAGNLLFYRSYVCCGKINSDVIK